MDQRIDALVSDLQIRFERLLDLEERVAELEKSREEKDRRGKEINEGFLDS